MKPYIKGLYCTISYVVDTQAVTKLLDSKELTKLLYSKGVKANIKLIACQQL